MVAALAWLPLAVSAVLIVTLWMARVMVGLGSPRSLAILTLWFLVAGWLQLFTGTLALRTTGVVLQAVLAVYLVLRMKTQDLA